MNVYFTKGRRKYVETNYERKYLLDPKYMTKQDIRHYYRYYNMANKRSQFKKIVILIFCLCFFCYIFIGYNLKSKIIHLRDRFGLISKVEIDYNERQAYFVNTPGCRMPYFPAIDENILQFITRPQSLNCQEPLTRTSDISTSLIINMNAKEIQKNYNITDLSSAYCYYREIKRKSDSTNEYSQYVQFKLEANRIIDIPEGFEFINVACRDSENRTFYEDFHFFVFNKLNESVKGKRSYARNYGLPAQNKHFKSKYISHWDHLYPNTAKATATVPDETEERVSVMLLGIDTVSHLHFLRQLQRTAALIRQNLTHVEFWGYNKVGDNTYPNLVPVLTGLDETELNIACLEPVKRANFDKCHFIWNRFKETGYQTVFAEDVASVGLFNYCMPGFDRQPTDYYFCPLLHEIERYIGSLKDKNVKRCINGPRTAGVLFELMRKLIPYLAIQDFFSFFWTVTMSHDNFNTPILLDEDFVHIFELFNKAGIFNKTVIFLMSDHGIRWGSFRMTYQGMVEERQPLLIALYPKWFRQKYDTAIGNMELNANRLTTPFDLHATLLDLHDLRNIEESKLRMRTANLDETETLSRGISLFLPIPITRTCDNAGVAPHWCLCYQREDLATNDARVQRAARYLIKIINERLKEHRQCRTLYLNSIQEATIAAPHKNIIQNVTNDYSSDITVRIQAKPGLGLFESTLRMTLYTIGLAGGISRLNLYGSQSYCIDVKELKMFCYCYR